MTDNLVDKTVSHYRILAKIGSGGMGVVYKAMDTRLNRLVALKFLPREDFRGATDDARFEIEAQAAASLDHPNIGAVYEIDSYGEQKFIAMAYLEGKTLGQSIDAGSLPLNRALDYAIQIAAGLEAAHAKDIIHRDIKADNIIITGNHQVKITDFGLAKQLGGPRVTQTGIAAGTVDYMSPEQGRAAAVDARSDIWSLGVLLYEMVTGALPFQGNSEQAVLFAIFNEEPKSLTQRRQSVPRELQRIIDRCLAKRPNRRYGSCAELRRDLLRLQQSLSSATSPLRLPGSSPWRKWVRRLAWLLIPAALLTLIIAMGGRDFVSKLTEQWRDRRPIPAEVQLVVLPFRCFDETPASQAFCAGLTEIVSRRLVQLQEHLHTGWIVAPSAFEEWTDDSPRDIKRRHGANLALTGDIHRIDGKLKLSLQVLDAGTQKPLRHADLDLEGIALDGLLDELSANMAELMNIELPPQSRRLGLRGSDGSPAAFAIYTQGRGYLQRFDEMSSIDTAIQLFSDAVEMNPENALAFSGLGEAYWRKFELNRDREWVRRALHYSDHALGLEPNKPEVHITLGLIHKNTGQPEAAIRDFKRALEFDPFNAHAYRELAGAYESLDKLSDAENAYLAAIELKPEYWAGYNLLGKFYFHHNRLEDAVDQFERVLALTPDNCRGLNNLGGLCIYRQEWDKARRLLERSLAIEPNFTAYTNLGVLYGQMREYEKAVMVLEQALALDALDFRVWGNLAGTYEHLPGKEEETRLAYLEAVHLAEALRLITPRDRELYWRLAGYHAALGDSVRAEELLDRLIEMGADSSVIMYNLGHTYEQIGYRDLALEWIEKALLNGYPLWRIKSAPQLNELRKDARFEYIERQFTDD